MIKWVLLAVVGLILMFVVIPSITVCYFLFKRKHPQDFDHAPERLQEPSYAPWKETILEGFAWVRSQPFEEIGITAYDGVPLKAEWLDMGQKRTVVMAHGFRSTPFNNYAVIGRAFAEKGWNLLLLWQRGHGKSGGDVTTFGLREQNDVRDWVRWVDDKIHGEIVLYGISMGGASVGYASGGGLPPSVKAMVLDCAYCRPYNQMLVTCKNGPGFLKSLIPLSIVAPKVILQVDMMADIRDSLRKTTIPAMFVCGLNDETISAEEISAAYDACASPKELLLVPGATHTMSLVEGGEEVQGKVFAFLEKHMTH